MFCNVCLSCRCECSEGYARDSASRACVPQCRQSCVHGTCVAPDVCLCTFGHVGRSCEHTCLCNGHSNCQVTVFLVLLSSRILKPVPHGPTSLTGQVCLLVIGSKWGDFKGYRIRDYMNGRMKEWGGGGASCVEGSPPSLNGRDFQQRVFFSIDHLRHC